jgi:N-methylhydantoinase B
VVKLVADGEINADLWKMILANVRAQREVAGDLRAQIAANNMGLRRLAAVYQHYGSDRLSDIIEELLHYTEKRTRAELAKLPHGTWEAEGFLDDDGISDRPVRLKVRITIDGDGILFDFAGTDPQRWAPMNCNLTQTFTACVYVLKCLIDPDVPINEGFYKAIKVVAPEGATVNARHPGAIVGGWEVSTRLCEVLFKALSEPMPEKVPAGTKGMICHVGFGGADPRSGEYYTFLETLAGGYGGRHRSDGPDAVQTNVQNTQNAPVEETELNYPVRIARYSLIADSEGPGRFRGGLGLCREYVFPAHEPIFTTLADRAKFPPWGLFGGGDGKPARYLSVRDGQIRTIPSKGTAPVAFEECVRIETCGGGGYGPAWQRDPALVLRDVREEKVSLQRARDVYGVVIDTSAWTIDADATRRLRHAMGGSERHA